MYHYSKLTGCVYIEQVHADSRPADAVPITKELYLAVIANPTPGKIRSHDAAGLPILIDPPVVLPTAEELCAQIDAAADNARARVAGDPLRAVEYQLAASEALVFRAAGYPADAVPRTVSAWVKDGRTPQQAADSILVEADRYNEALYLLRETRLHAKGLARQAMASGNIEQAQGIAAEAVAAIEAAAAGVGNA